MTLVAREKPPKVVVGGNGVSGQSFVDNAAFRAECEQVSVYTAGDLSFLGSLPGRGFSRLEIAQIEQQILSRESYYIPRARIAYLAGLSLNHAAEEAAQACFDEIAATLK